MRVAVNHRTKSQSERMQNKRRRFKPFFKKEEIFRSPSLTEERALREAPVKQHTFFPCWPDRPEKKYSPYYSMHSFFTECLFLRQSAHFLKHYIVVEALQHWYPSMKCTYVTYVMRAYSKAHY